MRGVLSSRVESNTLCIAPNSCVRLSTQVGLTLGKQVSKGNNFVQKTGNFPEPAPFVQSFGQCIRSIGQPI